MATPTRRTPPRRPAPRGLAVARAYVAVLVVAVLGFVALAVLADTHQIFRFDVALTRTLQSVHVAFYRWVMVNESDLGYEPFSPLTYLVIFALLFATRLRVAAFLAVISSLLADGVGAGIKHLIARARPSSTLVHVAAHLHSFSFPSGHVIQYTTLFGFTLYTILVAWKRTAPRAVLLIVLALLIILVGPSRVYLGEHWPTDVTGGYLFGGVWLAATIWVYRRLAARHRGWFRTHELERMDAY